MDHFGFKVRSMPEMLAAVRAAGYTVQSEFTGAEGFPNAYFLGPDGLRVEMQEDKTLLGEGHPESHSLHHAGLREAARLVRRHLLADQAQPRDDQDDRRCRDRESVVSDQPDPDRPDQGPNDRSHRLRGEGSRRLRQAARGEGHQVRCRLSRGAGDRSEDRLHHRSVGCVYRADGRLRELLSGLCRIVVDLARARPVPGPSAGSIARSVSSASARNSCAGASDRASSASSGERGVHDSRCCIAG